MSVALAVALLKKSGEATIVESTLEVRMVLPRLKFLMLMLALPVACDTTAPFPAATDIYVLESVNGSPPPRLVFSAEGYSATILWSTLYLDDATSTAVLIDRVRRTSPNAPEAELTETRSYAYQINGDDVLFYYSPPCPPNALCEAPPAGKLGASTVTLYWGEFYPLRSPAIYRLTASE